MMKNLLFVVATFLLASCCTKEIPYFDVTSSKDLAIDAEGGILTASVKSNVSWNANCSEDWITLNPEKSDGDRILEITVAANPTREERTGIITFTSDANPITFNIKQSIRDYIDVTESSIAFSWKSGNETFDITSNAECSLSVSETWVHLERLTSSKSQPITESWQIKADENRNERSRTANITIKNGSAEATINVSQDGYSLDGAGGQDATIGQESWEI